MNFYLKSHYFSIMYLLVWIFPIYRAKQKFFSNHSIAPNNGKIEIVAVRSYASGTLMPFNRNIAKKYSEHFFLEKREILIFTTIILH